MTAATRAIHADDFFSTHKAIAPGMHTAVNYRYHRDPELLVPMENTDVSRIDSPGAHFLFHYYVSRLN